MWRAALGLSGSERAGGSERGRSALERERERDEGAEVKGESRVSLLTSETKLTDVSSSGPTGKVGTWLPGPGVLQPQWSRGVEKLRGWEGPLGGPGKPASRGGSGAISATVRTTLKDGRGFLSCSEVTARATHTSACHCADLIQ